MSTETVVDVEDMTEDFHEPNTEKYYRLLPVWFTGRMLEDFWTFGLLLTTGKTMIISSVTKVAQAADGSVWIDVNMVSDKDAKKNFWIDEDRANEYFGALTDRLEASINVAHIIAAFEMADS